MQCVSPLKTWSKNSYHVDSLKQKEDSAGTVLQLSFFSGFCFLTELLPVHVLLLFFQTSTLQVKWNSPMQNYFNILFNYQKIDMVRYYLIHLFNLVWAFFDHPNWWRLIEPLVYWQPLVPQTFENLCLGSRLRPLNNLRLISFSCKFYFLNRKEFLYI